MVNYQFNTMRRRKLHDAFHFESGNDRLSVVLGGELTTGKPMVLAMLWLLTFGDGSGFLAMLRTGQRRQVLGAFGMWLWWKLLR